MRVEICASNRPPARGADETSTAWFSIWPLLCPARPARPRPSGGLLLTWPGLGPAQPPPQALPPTRVAALGNPSIAGKACCSQRLWLQHERLDRAFAVLVGAAEKRA